jgi:hypothetical protein
MGVSGQLHDPAALPPGKEPPPPHSLDRTLGGPQSRSGRGGEDKSFQPLPGHLKTLGVHLALFVDDKCTYTTGHKGGYVLRKLQRGLTSMESWCERWNIKINEDKTRAIYFSHRRRLVEANLTLKGRNVPYVNRVEHFGVIFNKRITLRMHIDTIPARAFRTFIRDYSLPKSEGLSVNIKLTLHKALTTSKMT